MRRISVRSWFLVLAILVGAYACDEILETIALGEIEALVGDDLRLLAGDTGTLAVRVVDEAGEPVPDIVGSWTVVSGGGSVTPTELRTDANGEARTEWTVGSTLGEQVVEAEVDGLDPFEFVATVVGPVDTLTVLTDSLAFLALGDTASAEVHAVDGLGQDRSDGLTWTSRDPAVASVDSVGRVVSEAVGETWVTASASGLSDSARVTVTQVAARVQGSPPDSIFVLGDSAEAAAAVYDANDFEIPGAPVAWSSLDTGIVEMRGAWAIAKAVGDADIVAEAEGLADTIPAWVTPPSDPPSWEVVFEGQAYTDIWATSATDVWAITQGTLRRYDGTSWTSERIHDSGSLASIWGSGPDDVWVGSSSLVLHYDGAGWTSEELPSNNNQLQIHGTGPSDVFAVSVSGNIWHYDGADWTQVSTGYGALEDVWATSSDDVWVAGVDRTLVHYDGTDWTEVVVPEELAPDSDHFLAVWASSATDVWVAPHAHDRGLLHYDGTAWEFVDFGVAPPAPYEDIWGTGPDDIWVTGTYGNVLHYDGASWTRPYSDGAFGRFYGIWGTGDGHVFAAGASYEMGANIVEWDGAAWTVHHRGFGHINDAWSASPTDVWAVTSGGRSLHYDGMEWSYVPTGVQGDLRGVWGAGPGDVRAVGRDGQIVRNTGAGWTAESSGVTTDLTDIWGRSATDVWAVGDSGTVLHYDGSGWSPVAGGPTGNLTAVRGTGTAVYVGGHIGAVHRYEAGSWTEEIPMTESVTDLWSGKGVTWSAHANGYVGRYDGGEDWPTERPIIYFLHAITGTTDPDVVADVIAVGGRNVLHHNGIEWSEQSLPAGVHPLLRAVVAVGPDEYFALGSGIILRGTR